MPVSFFELVSFMGLAVVLALVPGPNLAVVLRNASRGGQPAATATALGLSLSKAVWAAASLVGLASALNASAEAYSALKILGGVYLVYLGVSALRSRSVPSAEEAVLIEREAGRAQDNASFRTLSWAVRDGALSDVLNPKVGAFYLAVFPQYIEPGDNVVWAGALLLLAHAVVLMSYYPLVAALSLRLRGLGRHGAAKKLDTIIGAALVGTGSFVIADSV